MSSRKRDARPWCGVIPTAVVWGYSCSHAPSWAQSRGLGTAQQGETPRAGEEQDGRAWLSSRRTGGARWWLLLDDDDEYEIGAGEHGSNSVSAHAVSDHGLKSISLHQLKLLLLHRFPHRGCVLNQAGESMQGKTNQEKKRAEKERAAMAHHTKERNARQNVPTGPKKEHYMF